MKQGGFPRPGAALPVRNWLMPAAAWLLMALGTAKAGDTVMVAQDRFGYDPDLGLLVVAMTGPEVEALWTDVKDGVLAGQLFLFDEAVPTVETGVKYMAGDTSGNEVSVYFTDLPLVWVTSDEEIMDEPKVPGHFSMWSPDQVINGYRIGVEYRGGYSQNLPKKSMLIEFREDSDYTATMDVALLGLRSDDDWNLQAMTIEPLRLRTTVGHDLWRAMHEPYYAFLEPNALSGVRHAYVELFLNGAYHGLYALGERVDRKQLQVKKTTGQYRGLVFKGVDWGGITTLENVPPPYEEGALYWAGFKGVYPKEAPDWGSLSDFVHFVVETPGDEFQEQIDLHFHRGNAIDYFIFMNVLKAADNRGKNIFISRYRQNEPFFYVPWDLDGVFGLNWDGSLDDGSQWQLSNGMYNRWLNDAGYRWNLCDRWWQLRDGLLTTDSIMARFHAQYAALAESGVYGREGMAWPEYTYDPDHLDYMAQWLSDRLASMDDRMINYCGTVGVQRVEAVHLRLYPNPATDRVVLETDGYGPGMRLELYNALGQLGMAASVDGPVASFNVGQLVPGTYVLRVTKDGMSMATRTLIVQ